MVKQQTVAMTSGMRLLTVGIKDGMEKAKKSGLTFDALFIGVNLAPEFKCKLRAIWNSLN